jgi:hypothetical protein
MKLRNNETLWRRAQTNNMNTRTECGEEDSREEEEEQEEWMEKTTWSRDVSARAGWRSRRGQAGEMGSCCRDTSFFTLTHHHRWCRWWDWGRRVGDTVGSAAIEGAAAVGGHWRRREWETESW